MNPNQLKILCIDDNRDIIQTVVTLLTKEGYLVYSAADPKLGLAIAKKMDPDLILLDIMMPGMNGYDLCKALQQDEQAAKIPVVFMSALTQPQNKVSALAVGGVDYLTKPLERKSLVDVTLRYAGKKTAWGACLQPRAAQSLPAAGQAQYKFSDFKISVIDSFKPDGAGASAVMALQPGDVYKLAAILGVTPARVARFIAGFSKRPYLPVVNPDDIKLGMLPLKFAVQNNIAAVNAPGDSTLLAISHPFNLELNEMIHGIMGAGFEFAITEPYNISVLYKLAEELSQGLQKIPGTGGMVIEEAALNRLRAAAKSVKNEINEPHVKYLTGKLLQFLAEERTAEIRIEAKGPGYLVRAGAANTPEEYTRFNRMTGNMVTARLKALAGMDIMERNKQQTGAFAITCHSVNYQISLSTAMADSGENLILTPAV